MKIKYVVLSLGALLTMPVLAQETYQMANLETLDLNGTARYVGMGGAMGALGGDISVISTNPAGIGVFRSNEVAGTMGIISQQDAKKFNGDNKTNLSFDQLGFVYSLKTNNHGGRMNFGFNYHKTRNFDNILSAAGSLGGNASQNKLTSTKFNTGIIQTFDKSKGTFDASEYAYNQVDALYTDNLLSHNANQGVDWYDAKSFDFNRSSKGYIGQYDFNLSGSIGNRVYLGMTVGLYDVHYNGYTEYSEDMAAATGTNALNYVELRDKQHITGTGVDFKAGVIFRPIETSPFRIGLTISSPTFYNLTCDNSVALILNRTQAGSTGENYDFTFYTPWKFGLSLGHTVGNYLAIGAEYEYTDYGATDARVDDGGYYDDYGSYYSQTKSDDSMNSSVKYSLKGVSTLKIGFELKPDPSIAVRLGYNYISPMYNEDGYKDPSVESAGNYYTSTTDYTNWKSTNRITAGLGFRFNKAYLDFAYQYSVRNGDFYPFTSTSGYSNMEDNLASIDKVSDKRHQVICTLGFKF